MTITAANMEEFLDIIAGLVERGIMFEANTVNWTVICTGGY